MYKHPTDLSPFQKDNFMTKSFPILTKPKIIGYFSVDEHRNYMHNASNLKYLSMPPNKNNVNFNLNLGYENVIHKPLTFKDEKLDHVLKCLLESNLYTPNTYHYHKQVPPIADFICFRGLLRMIMCCPYETKDDWIVLATKYKGIIYLCQRDTERQKKEIKNQNDIQTKIFSYGFKMEQYLLTDNPGQKINPAIPVNEAEEFCCIYKSKLGNLNLCYGAEMDGINSNTVFNPAQKNPNDYEFIEVKVKINEVSPKQTQNYFQFKLRNWWCQNFLVNIDRTIVGIRNPKGFVRQVEEVQTKNIPRLCEKYWSAAVCTEFLKKFLEMIQNILSDVDCPDTVYEFYWNPKSKTNISYNIWSGEHDLSFLPAWYTD